MSAPCETDRAAPLTPWERFCVGIVLFFLMSSACCLFCGCKQFYENAGVHVRTGSLTAPVEVSEPTSSVNLRALYAMDGIDMYAAKNCMVKMWYTNDYTNTYFGVVETRGVQTSRVEIEPCETRPVGDFGEAERREP